MKHIKIKYLLSICITVCIVSIVFLILYINLHNKKIDLTFSDDSGFFESDLQLTLTASDPSAVIYYTTDGSTPTLDSPCCTGSITITIKDRSSEDNILSAKTGTSLVSSYIPSEPVEKATVIRAFARLNYFSKTDIYTHTYFIGEEFIQKYQDSTILSLSIDPDDFFDEKTGIYVRGKIYESWIANGGDAVNTLLWEIPANFTQTGLEWERSIHLELFENADSTSLSEDLGVRILGHASRTLGQKSLKFFARTKYGAKYINYNLFPGNTKNSDETIPISTYSTFAIRNGGNDTSLTKFRNRYIQQLVNDRAFTTQETRPVIVFLNGEYWGIYTMQDDYNADYIYQNYDIESSNVVMVKCGEIEEGTEADKKLYTSLISYAQNHDLSLDENYRQISEMLDIQSFIDYYCTEIYIGNEDWINQNNNYRLWRSRTTSDKQYEDGKWRYMLYDTELSMGIYAQGLNYNLNSLKTALTMPTDYPGTQVILFSSLMQNNDFKDLFVNTFMDMLNTNFTSDHMNNLLEETAAEYEPFMDDYFKRFGSSGINEEDGSTDAYYKNLEELKCYINKRNTYIPTMLATTLNLEGEIQKLTIKTNNKDGGVITINTITADCTNGTFSGIYFDSIPITIHAEPKEGYEFLCWTGSIESEQETLTLTVTQAQEIQANFYKK